VIPASSPLVPDDSADAARDLQDRVARYARAIVVLSLVMGVASIATHAASEHHVTESGGVLHQLVHVASIAPALVVWLLCRGRNMSAATVQGLDAALTIATCTLFALLGTSAETSLAVTFSAVLATTYVLVGRSIFVPSTFRRSLVIGALGVTPTIAYLVTSELPRVLGQTPESARIFIGFAVLWCAAAALASAVNSRQIYGLRARIREYGKLGQYTLEEKIGEGGMGVVYRARHALLRRPAAIKLLSKEDASEKDKSRFEREVQLTSHLAHPNTVSIFDYGRTADGVFYYVMEYLDGLDLNRFVEAEGPLDPGRAIHIAAQVCGSLGEAHALNLVHRDIKPANIVLTERVDEPDVVKVVDFGLAKPLAQSDGDTRAGSILGTPLYLAPEAISTPENIDGRVDIYALGGVLYFLLTGRNVFEGRTVVELLGRHLLEEVEPPSRHLEKPLASDLEAIILRCLAKDRERRPASPGELRAELLSCTDAATYDRQWAARWWRERGATLKNLSHQAASRTSATMAVDFGARDEVRPATEPP
jgi:serine/threonine protein kinase